MKCQSVIQHFTHKKKIHDIMQPLELPSDTESEEKHNCQIRKLPVAGALAGVFP